MKSLSELTSVWYEFACTLDLILSLIAGHDVGTTKMSVVVYLLTTILKLMLGLGLL